MNYGIFSSVKIVYLTTFHKFFNFSEYSKVFDPYAQFNLTDYGCFGYLFLFEFVVISSF